MSRAFSMVELVIVVVIVGIVAAIAVPRFGGMAERALERRLVADLATLQKAAELFAVEHQGITVGRLPNGTRVDASVIVNRLTGMTNIEGGPNGQAIYGPYLRALPTNALNGLATIRVDGPPAGAGTHGWRYDSGLNVFQSDVAFEATLPDGTVVDHLGEIKNIAGVGVGAGAGAGFGG